MSRSSIEPLVVGRVVGDVIDVFTPSVEMSVTYPIRQVNNGCEIKTTALVDPPHVRIRANNSDGLYTIVTDIPADGDASQGCEIVEYEAPRPIIGIHRYVFTLFKQECPLMVMPPIHRHHFSIRHFANICGLGLPVAAVYFNAQKQAGGRRR